MMTIPFRAGAVAAMTFRMRRRVGQIRPWRRGSAALALLASLLPLAARGWRPAAQAQGSCLEIVLLEKADASRCAPAMARPP